MREEKRIVQQFYDAFGWRQTPDGSYNDTLAFVDLRSVLLPYYAKSRRRVTRYFRPGGEYFLDAGSGAIPHPESIEYSQGYRRHLCVDLSAVGLREARKKLQSRGLYVVADITRLPFREQVFDGILSAHSIYHVPADEQGLAVLELFRTLKPGHTCVIVYAWASCSLAKWATKLRSAWIGRRIAFRPRSLGSGCRRRQKANVPSGPQVLPGELPSLYYHAHDAVWFHQNLRRDDLQLEIRSARAIDRISSEILIPDSCVGGLLLALLSILERTFPFAMAEIGRYGLIILRKRPVPEIGRQ